MLHCLFVTAISRTAASRINKNTIHTVCNVSVDSSRTASNSGSARIRAPPSTSLREDRQSRMDWQEKDVLVIDKISIIGKNTARCERAAVHLSRLHAGLRRDPSSPLSRRLQTVPVYAGTECLGSQQ